MGIVANCRAAALSPASHFLCCSAYPVIIRSLSRMGPTITCNQRPAGRWLPDRHSDSARRRHGIMGYRKRLRCVLWGGGLPSEAHQHHQSRYQPPCRNQSFRNASSVANQCSRRLCVGLVANRAQQSEHTRRRPLTMANRAIQARS